MGTYALEGHRRGHPARRRYHGELFVSTDWSPRGIPAPWVQPRRALRSPPREALPVPAAGAHDEL